MVLAQQMIRIVLLCFSFYGYFQFFSKHIRAEFIPACIFSAVSCLLFISGIFRLLPVMAILIFITGLLFAIFFLYKRTRFSTLLTFGTISFFCASLLFLFLLHNAYLTHIDNFTHWALPPKIMLANDRFPNAQDANFTYLSYPVGSAVWIYYICRITGIHTEGMQIFSQVLLTSSFLTGIFALSKNLWAKCCTLGACILFLSSNNTLTDLLVDTLLSTVCIGGLTYCYYYRDNLYKHLPYLLPISVFLITIKNSGIFFMLLLAVYALSIITKAKRKQRSLLMLVLPPICVLLLWRLHVRLTFTNGMIDAHAMSFEYYAANLSKKSSSELLSICSYLWRTVFSLKNPFIWLGLFFLLLLLVLRLHGKVHFSSCKRAFTFTLCTYIVYQFGMLGMYIFSMLSSEALELAGYVRYHNSFLVVAQALLFIEILQLFPNDACISPQQIAALILSAIFAICYHFTIDPAFWYYKKQDISGTDRARLEQIISNHTLPSSKRYVFLISPEDGFYEYSYLQLLVNYRLSPVSLHVLRPNETTSQFLSSTNHDYVIAFDKCPENYEIMTQAQSENTPGKFLQ